MQSEFRSLTSSTNASVTLTNPTTVDNYTDTWGAAQTRSRTPRFGSVEVVNVDGNGIVYFRLDDTHPTLAGADAYVVPAVEGASVKVPVNASTVVVRMIASANTQVGVVAS